MGARERRVLGTNCSTEGNLHGVLVGLVFIYTEKPCSVAFDHSVLDIDLGFSGMSLVPKRVSDDDKLIEYDALLLDRFLDIVEDSCRNAKNCRERFVRRMTRMWRSSSSYPLCSTT